MPRGERLLCNSTVTGMLYVCVNLQLIVERCNAAKLHVLLFLFAAFQNLPFLRTMLLIDNLTCESVRYMLKNTVQLQMPASAKSVFKWHTQYYSHIHTTNERLLFKTVHEEHFSMYINLNN